jgi:hypothetical protein
MSQITVNDRVYTIHKTYEAALGAVLCFMEPEDSGLTHTMILTPDGDWKFTGSNGAELKRFESNISDAIIALTEHYPICFS